MDWFLLSGEYIVIFVTLVDQHIFGGRDPLFPKPPSPHAVAAVPVAAASEVDGI